MHQTQDPLQTPVELSGGKSDVKTAKIDISNLFQWIAYFKKKKWKRNVLLWILRFVWDDFRLLVFEVDSFVVRDIDCARGPKPRAILLSGSLCQHVFGQAVVQGLPVTLRIHNIIL